VGANRGASCRHNLRKDTVYVVIDCEVSGQSLAKHGLMAIGVHAACGSEYLQFRDFLDTETREFDPDTLAFFKRDAPDFLEQWKAESRAPGVVMHRFTEFMTRVRFQLACNNTDRILFCCDNPSLDASWMNYYLALYTDISCLSTYFGRYKPVMDIDSYRAGWLAVVPDADFGGFSADAACAAEVRQEKFTSTTHDPLDDAIAIYKNFMLVLDYVKDLQATTRFPAAYDAVKA